MYINLWRWGSILAKAVRKIIAVGSGKGGVGKSTVAVNIALALSKNNAKVGILDADIYGPSQPLLLGSVGVKPELRDGKLVPIKRHGLQSMSIGYLIEQTAPVVWRGPMIGKALQQLLEETAWEDLDYLIVDLPPGTGDVQLTLCQKIPIHGAVMVTTPQDVALLDVRRAYEMFLKLNVPVLGVVENMSTFHCAACGHEEPIFGIGGGAQLTKEYGLTLLGAIPLQKEIREMTDQGQPLLVAAPASSSAQVFYDIAEKIKEALAKQPKDYSRVFPKIVVSHEKE